MDSQLPPVSGQDIENALRLIAALSDPKSVKTALESMKIEKGDVETLFKNASEAQKKADVLEKQNREIAIVNEAKANTLEGERQRLSDMANDLAGKATTLAQSKRDHDLKVSDERRELSTLRDELTKREVAITAREKAIEGREQAAAQVKAEYEAKLSALRNAVA